MRPLNGYKITLKVEAYLEHSGGIEDVMKALGMKRELTVRELIKNQSWTERHRDKLVAARIITYQIRHQPRKKIDRAEEITRQVLAYVEKWSSISKFCKNLGFQSRTTYNNRIEFHSWTEQDKALLINERILDDSF